MTDEQQAINNKLIKYTVNGKTEQVEKLLTQGASPLAHDCMAIKEAVNNDRLDILKTFLKDEKTSQHIKENPDVFYFSFLYEQDEKLNCLKFIANETNIAIDSIYDKNDATQKQALEFINKARLNYRLNQQALRPKVKSKSFSMKI